MYKAIHARVITKVAIIQNQLSYKLLIAKSGGKRKVSVSWLLLFCELLVLLAAVQMTKWIYHFRNAALLLHVFGHAILGDQIDLSLSRTTALLLHLVGHTLLGDQIDIS